MKLDPGIHIGMHLVCFSKTRCDIEKSGTVVDKDYGNVDKKLRQLLYTIKNGVVSSIYAFGQ
jgi:hypothetical protein